MADNEADLRAALHAAVEAGVIEGWQYAFPREHVDEWRISLTTEQARALVKVLGPHCGTCCGGRDENCREDALHMARKYEGYRG